MSVAASSDDRETPVGESPGQGDQYVGLATRAVAFIIDALVIDLAAVVVAAAIALIASIFHFPKDLDTILKWIGLGLYVLWLFGYFVGFWSATGQTPGNRVMQIRVLTAGGERVGPRRGVVRCIGLVLAALPLFAGYVLIVFDPKRRGLQDRLARTLVIEAPDVSVAQARRLRRRQTHEGGQRRPASTAR